MTDAETSMVCGIVSAICESVDLPADKCRAVAAFTASRLTLGNVATFDAIVMQILNGCYSGLPKITTHTF